MANIVLEIGEGIEVAAGDVIHWTEKEVQKAITAAPKVIAALGVLASGVEKALTDVEADAANPLSAIITIPQQLQDFIALWPDLKLLFEQLGLKKI